MQVPYLADHYRVVTFDGRGNGRSDRPVSASSYAGRRLAADALAVMDATGTDRAVLVIAVAGRQLLLLAAGRPPGGGAGFPLPDHAPGTVRAARLPYACRFLEPPDRDEGWAEETPRTGARLPRVPGLLLLQVFAEPHSTKPIEDAIGWGLRPRRGR